MAPEVRKDNKKACLECQAVFSGELVNCPNDGTVLTALADDNLVGTVLDDRYEILAVIGGGGMGMVYRAKQRFINRMVAVKVLHKGSISSVDTLKRFQLEAQAASALSNPHIVTVFDSNVSKTGEPYMVMDYLEGESLDGILESQGALAPARALNIFVQVCDALAKAHVKNIVHRDIKPSNIVLVNEDGEPDFVKIVDFGIAKILREGDSKTGNLTRTGEIFGSPHYMSPEQWRGGKLDARTDIYSLGAVMYRSLAGAPLYTCTDVLQFAYKHVQEMPPTITSLGIPLPDRLEVAVFKALSKDADDRFQSMQELREELCEIQKNLPPQFATVPRAPSVVSGGLVAGRNAPGSDSESSNPQAVSTGTQEWLRDLTPPKLINEGSGANRSAATNPSVVTPNQGDINNTGDLEPSLIGQDFGVSISSNVKFSNPIKPPDLSSLSSLGSAKVNEQTVQLTIPKKTLKVGGVAASIAVVAVIGAFAFSSFQHHGSSDGQSPGAQSPGGQIPAGTNLRPVPVNNASVNPNSGRQNTLTPPIAVPIQHKASPASAQPLGVVHSPSGTASSTAAHNHAKSESREREQARTSSEHEKTHVRTVYTEKKNGESLGIKKALKKFFRKL